MKDTDSEVVFNTLLADGTDFPTAYAASIEDCAPSPAMLPCRASFNAGLLAGIVLYVLWLLI